MYISALSIQEVQLFLRQPIVLRTTYGMLVIWQTIKPVMVTSLRTAGTHNSIQQEEFMNAPKPNPLQRISLRAHKTILWIWTLTVTEVTKHWNWLDWNCFVRSKMSPPITSQPRLLSRSPQCRDGISHSRYISAIVIYRSRMLGHSLQRWWRGPKGDISLVV